MIKKHPFRNEIDALREVGARVTINNTLYLERIGFYTFFNFDDLQNVDWHPDHLLEADNLVNEYKCSIRYGNYAKIWASNHVACFQELSLESNSRRAVIHFIDKAMPCLETVQFLIRNNALNVIANYRSLELEEFALYDLCVLIEMAKMMASLLNVKQLGQLVITAGSVHIIA